MSSLGSHHLTLRPGAPVMARSPGILQVGLDEPTARVPDDPSVTRLLRALGRPGGVPAEPDQLPPPAAAALTTLYDAGLVVPVPSTEHGADPSMVALRAQFGPDAVRRRAARDATAIAVRADPATRSILDPLLAAAGVRAARAAEEPAAATLVVTAGPVAREAVDPLTRGSVPHLLVTGGASGRRVGPFVDPGRTACLRCVDAHEALRDPRRPLLVIQAAAEASAHPPPRDPVLDHLALAWAARDLARYLEGDEPSTWSTTVDIGPLTAPQVTRWGRHPYCGCAWDAILELP
ncbi:hypothetical protein [Nocardioides vastitatis]|uniref:Bacteriocin biosynthesis cyclodehydratase domain-containing protein n=3 Tax=Nocardioides TaxID=1839 RepID=A0ABW0ZCJ1_9ACTN